MNDKARESLKAMLQTMVGEAVASAVKEVAPASAKPKSGRFEKKDAALLRGFARKGIKDVRLMDRTDPSKDFNVRPFKAWVERGRIVKKGEHGVRGLFHVSQTEELPKATS